MGAIEVEQKTLEDLAMLVVKEKNPTLYDKRILPIYDAVKDITRDELEVEGKKVISYASSYVSDLNADSQDILNLIADFEDEFFGEDRTISMPDEEANEMATLYDTVIYFLGDERAQVSNSRAKALVDTSYEAVSNTFEEVKSIINELTEQDREFNFNTKLASICGVNQADLATKLKTNLIKDGKKTEELMKGTVYDVVKYVAQRDVQL